MKFNYQGRTKDGESRIGQVEASSKEAALNVLQKHDLYVTFLGEDKAPVYAKRIKLFEGVSRKDVVLFSRQLSIMFRAKVSLIEALRVLATQMKNADFKEKIFEISEEIEAGTSFSKALAKHSKTFSPFYISMIKSGELSGKLSEVLNFLAEHLEREYHLTAKAKGAMVYPALVILVVIAVITLMVYFVIPNLTQVLESSGQALPLSTMFVIKSSEFLKSWGWLLILANILLIAFIFRYRTTAGGKKVSDKLLLKIPFLNTLLKTIYTARFAENLSTLISGGLPIAQALETTSEVMGNTAYKEIVLKTKEGVTRGESVSSVLANFPDLFSPIFVQMVLVGEKTGELDDVLKNITEFYQKEIDATLDSLLSILEPVMIVFLGVMVAGIMFSILTPLYQMLSI
ncbi:MAG: type II secretion system F family protein [Candidatus Nealsonbacteria bacterium]